MPRDKQNERLGQVLTKKQIRRVEQIMNCKLGKDQLINSLKEFYNEPIVSRRLKKKGWNPEVLAYMTVTNYRISSQR